MEDNLIYMEIRGSDEFNYDDEDQVNADREIYLSEQVTAFKVKMSQIYQRVDHRSHFKSRAVLVLTSCPGLSPVNSLLKVKQFQKQNYFVHSV